MELKLCVVVLLSILAFGFVESSSDCDSAKILNRTGPFNTLTEGWYKVLHHELEDDEIKSGDCDIKYPIWGRGQYPDDGEVADIVGCVANETDSCVTELSLKVRDCGDYDVYYLKPTTSIDQAYCFRKEKDDHDDDDEDCEEKKHHGKRFHRCHRNHRKFVVVIGIVAIVAAGIAIAAFILYRRRQAAAQARKDQYKEKSSQNVDGPVVVVTNDALPPKY